MVAAMAETTRRQIDRLTKVRAERDAPAVTQPLSALTAGGGDANLTPLILDAGRLNREHNPADKKGLAARPIPSFPMVPLVSQLQNSSYLSIHGPTLLDSVRCVTSASTARNH